MDPIAALRPGTVFAAVDAGEYECCGELLGVGEAQTFVLATTSADMCSGLFAGGVTTYVALHEGGDEVTARVLRLWESRDDSRAVDGTGRSFEVVPGTTRVVEVSEMTFDTAPRGWVLELAPIEGQPC